MVQPSALVQVNLCLAHCIRAANHMREYSCVSFQYIFPSSIYATLSTDVCHVPPSQLRSAGRMDSYWIRRTPCGELGRSHAKIKLRQNDHER